MYAIEAEIRGRPPDQRRAVRQARAAPVLGTLHAWLESILQQVSRKSGLAEAVRYALGRWRALTRYCDDGRLEIDNNAAERALRPVALGRKNYLFAGSNKGGDRVSMATVIDGEPITLSDAILDRPVHNAYKFALKGDSMRKRRQALTQTGQSDA